MEESSGEAGGGTAESECLDESVDSAETSEHWAEHGQSQYPADAADESAEGPSDYGVDEEGNLVYHERASSHPANLEPGDREDLSAIVIVRSEEDEDGNIEFYFEKRGPGYEFEEYRGRLSLLGGHLREEDDSPLDALVRELFEEVGDPVAAKIIAKNIRGTFAEVRSAYTAKDSSTYEYRDIVYEAVIPQLQWQIVKQALGRGPDPASGTKEIVRLSDIGSRGYIFSQGDVVSAYVRELFGFDTGIKADAHGRVIEAPWKHDSTYAAYAFQSLSRPSGPRVHLSLPDMQTSSLASYHSYQGNQTYQRAP